jgi:hypothetical protein
LKIPDRANRYIRGLLHSKSDLQAYQILVGRISLHLGSLLLRAADRLMSLIVEALLDLSSYLKNKQILIDSGCLGRSAGACPAETPAGPA